MLDALVGQAACKVYCRMHGSPETPRPIFVLPIEVARPASSPVLLAWLGDHPLKVRRMHESMRFLEGREDAVLTAFHWQALPLVSLPSMPNKLRSHSQRK